MSIADLRASVTGPVLTAEDDGYAQELHTYNLTVVHAPSVIVGAENAADVQAAVRYAAALGRPVAVLGAGHGTSVSSAGAVMVTTRRLTGLSIDETTRTARVEAGVRWAEFVEQAGKLGLAGLNGSSPTVTVVSYMIGGGLGPFGRKYGYAADHVSALEVVTADGALRRVTATSEPELFWAVRGGKGNFGVVVAIEFDVFPIRTFYGGAIYFPGELSRDVLHLFASWTAHAGLPEEMSASVGLLHLPPLPFVPEPLRDRLVAHLRITYLGNPVDGARLIAPFRALGEPIIDAVAEIPYTAVASVHNDPVDPLPLYEHGALLRSLPPEAVDAFLRLTTAPDSPLVLAEIRHLGGALSRPPAVPNAVGNRDDDTAYNVFLVAAGGPPDAGPLHAYEQAVVDALAPWSTGRRYLNFMFGPDATVETSALAWAPADYPRLRAVKREYDPGNLFRINHNIPPA